LWSWGREQGMQGGTVVDSLTPNLKNISVKIPQPRVLGLWETIFRWFFLGILDSNSEFGKVPVEVILHAVNVWVLR
jgi:hypothetical protein